VHRCTRTVFVTHDPNRTAKRLIADIETWLRARTRVETH
jgi:hypothetical protein